MTQLPRSLLALLLIAMAAVHADAQTALVTELASFKGPYQVIPGAIARLADGRIFGLLQGGVNGAIYKAVANGAGGFTQTVVYEFGENEVGPFGTFTPTSLVAAADGRIYYAGMTLWRFDPDEVTVEHLVTLQELANALRMGIDGHTMFGSHYGGAIFSYDATTGVYQEINAAGISGLLGVEQMTNGSLAALYSLPASQSSGSQVLLRRIDPITGAETDRHAFARGAVPPVKGDDGQIYIETSDTAGRKYFRIDSNPACFCLIQLFAEPFPTPAVRSIAGVRNGKLYIDRDFTPHRLDLTAAPPRLERLAAGAPTSRYDLAADGTLFMFGDDGVYALDTNTAVAELTPTALVATGLLNDGANGFPSDYTQGPDGMLYGISELTLTRYLSIFRIDPNSRARALVAEIDLGDEAGNGVDAYTTKMVLVDQQLYGTYESSWTLDSAIFRFDPSTNVVDQVRVFPFDMDNFTMGPDGILIHELSLGSDGWLYSMMDSSDLNPDWGGTIVRIDPASGAFETLARPALSAAFYPSGKLTEIADGIWLGSYSGGSGFCERVFRFDAATNTVTHFKGLRTAVEGCGFTLTRRSDGAVFGATQFGGLPADVGYGAGNIFRIDPVSGDITKLIQFTAASPVRFPVGTLSFGADGFLYSSYLIYGGMFSTNGLMRIDVAAGTAVSAAELTPSPGFLVNGFLIGGDGRFFTGLSNVWKALSVGVLDAMPMPPASAPFGGTTTISATLKATGIPMAGRTIAFTLNGNAIGSAVTNDQGVATLANVSVSGIAIGTHANAVAASFAGEEYFPATAGGAALTVHEVPTPGLMIGHGFVRDGAKHEFAFIVVELANGANLGGLELTRKNKGKARDDRFVSTSLSGVVFDGNAVMFGGTGKWNGSSGYRFEAAAEDVAGPGHQDSLRVTIYDASNHVVVTFDQEIDGGNIRSVRLRR